MERGIQYGGDLLRIESWQAEANHAYPIPGVGRSVNANPRNATQFIEQSAIEKKTNPSSEAAKENA